MLVDIISEVCVKGPVDEEIYSIPPCATDWVDAETNERKHGTIFKRIDTNRIETDGEGLVWATHRSQEDIGFTLYRYESEEMAQRTVNFIQDEAIRQKYELGKERPLIILPSNKTVL